MKLKMFVLTGLLVAGLMSFSSHEKEENPSDGGVQAGMCDGGTLICTASTSNKMPNKW